MMRERAIREGSVGLLILMAAGLFGGMVLWLRGYNPRQQSYRATFLFTNTLGIQEGAAVRFRGVRVGRVLAIRPGSNQVEVDVEISPPTLLIPSDSLIAVNQSGLIGETTVDITPRQDLTTAATASLTPFQPHCNRDQILCDGDQRVGQVGASYEALLRSAEELATTFADPELTDNLALVLKNASDFTTNATVLSSELTRLTQQVQTDLGPLMASANRATNNLDGTLTEIGNTATAIGSAANQFELTGSEVNGLISRNRGSLVSTLDSLNRSSANLETIMATLAPQVQDSQFITNLNRLSSDASAAVADIQALTAAANTPENLVMLQQTLDSARSVFQSAHKVIADVDELTGDPALRNNIRNLINGLGTLVSLTDQLEQDSRLAQALTLPRGAQVDRVILTPVSPPAAHPRPAPAAPGPAADSLLVTHNGQYYQLRLQAR